MEKQIIALLTDFGNADYYAGIMKGVISGIAPEAGIIDLSHSIAAQNVKQAAFILATSVNYFPENTIFIAVVDPGVGASRKAICVRCANRFFVGPDNGFLSYVLMNNNFESAVTLTNKTYFLPEISHTFHGRDIFSPVAAHLANGIPMEEFGPPIRLSELVKLESLKTQDFGGEILTGEVLYIDSFGNLITSISGEALFSGMEEKNEPPQWSFSFAGQEISGLSKTFENVEKGELLAYIASGGFLAVARREGNAAHILDATIGMKIKAIKSPREY